MCWQHDGKSKTLLKCKETHRVYILLTIRLAFKMYTCDILRLQSRGVMNQSLALLELGLDAKKAFNVGLEVWLGLGFRLCFRSTTESWSSIQF